MIGRKTKGGLISSAIGDEAPGFEAIVIRPSEGLGLGETVGDALGVGVLAGAASTVKAEQTLPFDSLTQTW